MQNFEHFMNRMVDHHNLSRWHNCPSGFKWRITEGEVQPWVGVIINPLGEQVWTFGHTSRSRIEEMLLRNLKLRTQRE